MSPLISNKRMNVSNKVFVPTKGDDLFPHLTKTTMYDIRSRKRFKPKLGNYAYFEHSVGYRIEIRTETVFTK